MLRYPETPNQNSVWIVDVVDAQARPLPVTGADVRFIARTQPGPIRVPRRDEIDVRTGLVCVRGLPPGKWELHVESPASLGGSLECSIDSPMSTQRSRIIVEVFMGRVLASTEIETTDDHLPWVDEAAELTSKIPNVRLALREPGLDRHFRATLKSGVGPVRGGELVVDLRASQILCENDSLSLEYVGGQGYAWSRSIQDLVPFD